MRAPHDRPARPSSGGGATQTLGAPSAPTGPPLAPLPPLSPEELSWRARLGAFLGHKLDLPRLSAEAPALELKQLWVEVRGWLGICEGGFGGL